MRLSSVYNHIEAFITLIFCQLNAPQTPPIRIFFSQIIILSPLRNPATFPSRRLLRIKFKISHTDQYRPTFLTNLATLQKKH